MSYRGTVWTAPCSVMLVESGCCACVFVMVAFTVVFGVEVTVMEFHGGSYGCSTTLVFASVEPIEPTQRNHERRTNA